MFRLLGLLGGLSVATDLGAGAPLEEALKRTVVAVRLAQAAGCSDREVTDVLYTALLQHLGCTAYAHEGALAFGDDIIVTRLSFLSNGTSPGEQMRTLVPGLAAATGRSRPRVLVSTLLASGRAAATAQAATCEVARNAARRLGLPQSVQEALFASLTSWDGKGHPDLSGDAIPRATRVMHVGSTALMFALHAGPGAAVTEVRRRSGGLLDPRLVDVFCSHADDLLAEVDAVDPHRRVLELEPDPVQTVDEQRLQRVAATFGDLADLKSLWLQGHSSAVASVAEAAAHRLGLGEDAEAVRVAGHLHDVGRMAVSSGIWSKPGPLTTAERDLARLHPYHSERVLARVPELARVAVLAGQHHERLDGTGYHRGVRAADVSMAGRILAATDAYCTLVEGRPHRAAAPPIAAAAELRHEARSGRLDGDAVGAVLAVVGQRQATGPTRPAGLTSRQVEVLRLVAAGQSNRDIAHALGITARTAEHHVQDVYLRIGVNTRAGAALFAMEHGLLAPPPP